MKTFKRLPSQHQPMQGRFITSVTKVDNSNRRAEQSNKPKIYSAKIRKFIVPL